MWSPRAVRLAGWATAALVWLAGAATAVGPPGVGRTVVLDAFTATAGQVAQVRADGDRPVCRLRVAVWEPHRPDAHRIPPPVRGERVGLFGDRWLDIRAWPSVAPVLSDRLRLCREKGFRTVRFDHDWGGTGGFHLTAGDWQRFDTRVTALAASHGLTPARAGAAGTAGTSTRNGWRTVPGG